MKQFHKNEFSNLLKAQNITFNEFQMLQFLEYTKLLQDWNQKMNLTAITEIDAVFEKHFYDSILPSFHMQFKGTLCDVGAGAGFPSIPLKILYPDLTITIIEPLNKRCLFLNEVCKTLKLDVTIINGRAEDMAKTYREQFDFVSARAVANLTMLSELCIPLLKKNGYFIAMKGSNALEEANHAEHAIKVLGCELESKQLHTLSDGSIRTNLFYKKINSTPKRFPRPFATIKKKPLI